MSFETAAPALATSALEARRAGPVAGDAMPRGAGNGDELGRDLQSQATFMAALVRHR